MSNKTPTVVYHKMTTICKHYFRVGKWAGEDGVCAKSGAIVPPNRGILARNGGFGGVKRVSPTPKNFCVLSLEKAVRGLRSGSQLGLGPEPAPDLDSELSGPGPALVLASDLLELGLAVGSELASVSG